MTPKEKAQEIYLFFWDRLKWQVSDEQNARYLALEFCVFLSDQSVNDREFWLNVKDEIFKIKTNAN